MSFRLIEADLTEGDEVENTTTETSAANKTFPLGSLKPGKVYGFECAIVVNDSNGADTLTPAVRFGSSATVTSNTAIWTGSAVNVEDADVGLIQGKILVRSATEAVITVVGTDGVDAVATLGTLSTAVVATLTNPDTAAHYLDITLDWSVAHADNEAAAMSWMVWEITD